MTPVPLDLDIITFATGKDYLAQELPPAKTCILKAIYGMEMNREERGILLKMTEGRAPNPKGYREAVLVCGRRGGKTGPINGTIATYEAVRWGTPRDKGRKPPAIAELLAPGQTAKAIIIAQNEKGATEARNYIEGNLTKLHDRYGGILAETQGQEKAITGKSVRLAGPVEIVIYTAQKHSVRGVTAFLAILDEIAWWEVAEGAYNQDKEVMRSVRPALISLSVIRPRLIMASSPNREEGELFREYERRQTSKALVVYAPTWLLNPYIPQSELDDAQEKDPEGFMREYGAQFQKTDSGAFCFIESEVIDKCVRAGVKQLPPRPGIDYLAWCDAAFKRDRFFFGIAHLEGGRVCIDLTLAWTPAFRKGHRPKPLDDVEIVLDIVAQLRHYGCERIFGDQFADIPLKSRFNDQGILFVESPATNPEKIDAFKNLRGALRAGLVSLPDDDIVKKDLKGLQKKETSGGNVTISAPRRSGCYDDAASVIARLVNRLLPLNAGADLAEINARAMPVKRPGVDWRQPSDGEFAGGIMEAVY